MLKTGLTIERIKWWMSDNGNKLDELSGHSDATQALLCIDFLIATIDNLQSETLEECAKLAETIKPDRFGKLERFQVADAIRELKEPTK